MPRAPEAYASIGGRHCEGEECNIEMGGEVADLKSFRDGFILRSCNAHRICASDTSRNNFINPVHNGRFLPPITGSYTDGLGFPSFVEQAPPE